MIFLAASFCLLQRESKQDKWNPQGKIAAVNTENNQIMTRGLWSEECVLNSKDETCDFGLLSRVEHTKLSAAVKLETQDIKDKEITKCVKLLENQ